MNPPSEAEALQALRVVVAWLGIGDAGMTDTPDELVPLAEAARIAATSPRVLRAAVRAGDLPAYGRQRDRAVRRADLARWIDGRRVRVDGVDDPDIARRVRRLRLVRGTR